MLLPCTPCGIFAGEPVEATVALDPPPRIGRLIIILGTQVDLCRPEHVGGSGSRSPRRQSERECFLPTVAWLEVSGLKGFIVAWEPLSIGSRLQRSCFSFYEPSHMRSNLDQQRRLCSAATGSFTIRHVKPAEPGLPESATPQTAR